LRIELLKHLPGFGFCVNGSEEIIRYRHLLSALVSSIPAAIRLRSINVLEAMGSHPALPCKPRDILDVNLTPDALLTARRVSLQKTLAIECSAQTVNPAPTESGVDSLLGSD